MIYRWKKAKRLRGYDSGLGAADPPRIFARIATSGKDPKVGRGSGSAFVRWPNRSSRKAWLILPHAFPYAAAIASAIFKAHGTSPFQRARVAFAPRSPFFSAPSISILMKSTETRCSSETIWTMVVTGSRVGATSRCITTESPRKSNSVSLSQTPLALHDHPAFTDSFAKVWRTLSADSGLISIAITLAAPRSNARLVNVPKFTPQRSTVEPSLIRVVP